MLLAWPHASFRILVLSALPQLLRVLMVMCFYPGSRGVLASLAAMSAGSLGASAGLPENITVKQPDPVLLSLAMQLEELARQGHFATPAAGYSERGRTYTEAEKTTLKPDVPPPRSSPVGPK